MFNIPLKNYQVCNKQNQMEMLEQKVTRTKQIKRQDCNRLATSEKRIVY